ncbi:MAG TPA: SH3 domain-containing protein [Ktedonobacterales bacterium]
MRALALAHTRATTPTAGALIYTQAPCAPVYTAPSESAPLITQLLGGTDVTLLDTATPGWSHIRIWSHTAGYTPSSALGATPPARASEGDCAFPGVPDPKPDVLATNNGPFPLTAQAQTLAPCTLYAWPDAGATPIAGLAAGAALAITQWASDSLGQPWYYARTSAGAGWIWSGAARLRTPDAATHLVSGRPIWSAVAGKGMWFTNYLTRHADLARLVADAKAAGVTHIYAEVAITPYGFYAPVSLDRLLPVAHAQGIAIIAWVYPTLNNVAADVRMSQQVAEYRTPSGDHADGLATDVEEVTNSASVFSYGQLLRGLLGPDTLLVDCALHPFTHAGYPYAAVAASWNVLAPMDYWHSRRSHVYTSQDVTAFVTTSVVTIRAAMQAAGVSQPIPIEELGQTYDMYSDDGAGTGHNPMGPEITADLQVAQQLGCIGASYFEWQTATQSQWDAFSAYRW